MSGIQTNSRPWLVQPLLLVLSVVACGINVANTIRDVDQYGGTDLRIRVVGARALTRGLNPYTLSQSADTDPLLRDPDHVQLSRCTYPPTLLLFYSPFSELSYPVQRKLWALLEWSAFFASVWLLSSLIHDSAARVWFWIVAAGLFGGSAFWRLHVERGQYYVFVVFLLSLGYFLQRKLHHRGDMAAGILNGIAIVLNARIRPPHFDFCDACRVTDAERNWQFAL